MAEWRGRSAAIWMQQPSRQPRMSQQLRIYGLVVRSRSSNVTRSVNEYTNCVEAISI
eukprot:COSAG02_NODE_5917_length_3941_cov_2.165279_5_plen_56_part_01